LAAISKELALRWNETSNDWNDTKAQEFERRYLSDLLARVEKTVTVVEKLEQVLSTVRSDCE